jgi:F-type H+-transporting ATPase subunit a
MDKTDLWLAKLFNEYLAGPANAVLGLIGFPAQKDPWTNFMVMQIFVVLLIMLLFAVLRGRLSVDRPGKFQQTFEVIYEFILGQTDEQIGHEGRKYMHFFGTLFIFILFANLIGLVPGLESPTMYAYVPAGCALATFFYYHGAGIQANGIGKHLKHFAGDVWWMSPLWIPIEIAGHLARPLSLTLRLYANMFAGEAVTTVFLQLTLLAVPAVFMALHLFVGLLQAYIFMLLTMVYVKLALPQHEH